MKFTGSMCSFKTDQVKDTAKEEEWQMQPVCLNANSIFNIKTDSYWNWNLSGPWECQFSCMVFITGSVFK